MASAVSTAPALTSSVPPKEAIDSKLLPGEHTLPASWWTSDKVFKLEKRALFNKSWLYCIHALRFEKAGDYYAFTVVGISFFIIKSKFDGELRAFHNVCRHRAYPVVKKERGSSTILGCKYHGWSYNSEGKLMKAPHFDQVEGFTEEENSLFPIKTHQTDQGLVFVNFSNEEGVLGFDEWFAGLQQEMTEFDFGDYEYHMSYELDGQFNWKTLMDGYQECYHCPTAHPGLSTAFKMDTYKVVPKGRYCRHYAEVLKEKVEVPEELPQEESSSWFGFGKRTPSGQVGSPAKKQSNPGGDFNGLWVYLFPSMGINCYSPAWYSIRVLPLSPTHTILQYDIYTKKGLSERKKKEFVDFLQLVEMEDFNLCQLTQKNLNQGVYSAGYLHPQKERGVLHYQGLVRDMAKEHFAREVSAGKQINPASVGVLTNASVQELDDICNQLECGSGSEEKLQW